MGFLLPIVTGVFMIRGMNKNIFAERGKKGKKEI
jgi:hypothetical protein